MSAEANRSGADDTRDSLRATGGLTRQSGRAEFTDAQFPEFRREERSGDGAHTVSYTSRGTKDRFRDVYGDEFENSW